MALPTISAGDLMGKGVTGTPAYPELSVGDLQAKFDELSIDVIVPKLQALVTALENASAGADLGVTAPTGITASDKVQSVLDAIAVILLAIKDKSDVDYDDLVALFTGITAVSNVVDGLTTTIPTAKAIAEYVQDSGGGDMVRVIYDTNNDGIVNNSERLDGQLPAYYAKKSDLDATELQLAEKASQVALNTEKTERLAEVAVERQRINLIQANPGSTSGDLALNDIAVGANGKIYDSPGDAVRGQIGDLRNVVFEKTRNYFILDRVLNDMQIGSSGNIVAYAGQNVMEEKIQVIPGQTWYFSLFSYPTQVSISVWLAYYDINNNFISKLKPTPPQDFNTTWKTVTINGVPQFVKDFVVPANASYAIVQYSTYTGEYDIELSLSTEFDCTYISPYIVPYTREDDIKEYINNETRNSTSISSNVALNSAYVNGLGCELDNMAIIANGMYFDNKAGNVRSKLGLNFSHDSMLVAGTDGKLYCAYVGNEVSTGDSPSNVDAYTALAVVNSVGFGTSSTVTRYNVAKYGDVIDGLTVISGVGVPNAVFVDSNTLRIIFSAKLSDGVYYLLYRDFNILTNTFGTVYKCSMVVEGTSYEFSTPNINTNIVAINNLDLFISMNAQISKNASDGYYYCGVCVVSQIPNSLIFRTLDMATFELWLNPVFTLGSSANFEGACLCKDGYLYYALRQDGTGGTYADNRMLIAKINISTKAIIDEYKIVDTVARACWLLVDNNIYLIHSICNRQRIEVILLNTDKLGNSRIVLQGSLGSVYPSFISLNGKYYFSSTGANSTNVYIREIPTLIKYNISDIQNKLAAALYLSDDF